GHEPCRRGGERRPHARGCCSAQPAAGPRRRRRQLALSVRVREDSGEPTGLRPLIRPCRHMIPLRPLCTFVLAATCLLAKSAFARVVRIDILSRTDVAGGASFGSAGPYERITGRVYFVFDPNNPHDKQIVDLALARRNAAGLVEAWSEFVMLRPKDDARAAGVALVDVVNRGGMTTGVFHLGSQRNLSPDSARYYGDALLLRQGLTVVMLGWQWDVASGGDRLHFGAPPVGDSAHIITGI